MRAHRLMLFILVAVIAAVGMNHGSPSRYNITPPEKSLVLDPFKPNPGSDRFEGVRLKIRRLLEDTETASVAVALAKDGKIIWEEGFGLADCEKKIPSTPQTMYSLASITKAMTMTGLMVLSERGLIDLDKPANDYLGPTKLRAYVGKASDATVKSLIFHKAGLPMHWNLFYEDESSPRPDMEESIRKYGILVTEPGDVYRYSNFGYGILDHIISRVSGSSYAEFMKAEVFEPLGMTRTAVLTDSGFRDNIAQKYGPGKRVIPFCDFDHRGASAVYSSAHDLVRFGLFHLQNRLPDQKRILKEKTLSVMHRESGAEFLDGEVPVKYLLGSFAQTECLGYVFHTVTGGMAGVVSTLDLIPSENIASAVLANGSGIDLWKLQKEILAVLLPVFGEKPSDSKPAEDKKSPGKFSPPEPLLGEWTGRIQTYRDELAAKMSFTGDGEVTLEINGKKYKPLPVKTELGDMGFKDGIFSGLFWGRIETPDTARAFHAVYIDVKLRDDRLNGYAAAVSLDNRMRFCLSHWIELKKD